MTEEILTQEQTDEQDLALQSTENEPSEPTVAELNERIASLTKELEAYKQAKERQDRISEQLNEFSELFPNIAPSAVPAEVWESVKNGNSLAAAYAVYEKRTTEAARRIEQINAKNAGNSAGAAGKNSSEEFFSADEVRKMSAAEVKVNYSKIIDSMSHWN